MTTSPVTASCVDCGAPLRDAGAFCPVCGAPRPVTRRPGTGVVAQQPGTGVAAPGSQHAAGVTTEPERLGRTRSAGFPPPPALPAPAGPGPVYAGVGRRFAVAMLDGLAMGVPPWLLLVLGTAHAGAEATTLAQLVDALAGWTLAAGALSLVLWLAAGWWEGATGAAVGGRLLGVRTVDAGTGSPVGFGRALLRALVLAVSGVVVIGPIVVLLSPLFDGSGRRQGWHDKVARAVVLRGGPSAARATPAAVIPGAVSPAAVTPAAVPSAGPGNDPWVFPAAAAPPRGLVAGPEAFPAATPAVGAPDPWAFPAAAAPSPGAAGVVTGVPLVTGVPRPAPATPAAPVAPAPSATPAAAVAPPAFAAEPDEEGWDVTRLSTRADAAPLTAAPVRPVALVLPDGTPVVVAGPTLVGRDPQAAEGGWALLPVVDPRRSVSKTHAALEVDGGGLWVTDRGSTNGTVVSEQGRPPRPAEPGVRVRVPVGATLHLGELRLGVREVAP